MSKSQPNFKTMNLDVITAAENFAKNKNVPELVRPAKVDSAQSTSDTRKPAATKKPKELTPTKRLAVFLPDYLVRAISDKAHANNTTIRYVVTHALQKAGFQIQPEDLREDGRRDR